MTYQSFNICVHSTTALTLPKADIHLGCPKQDRVLVGFSDMRMHPREVESTKSGFIIIFVILLYNYLSFLLQNKYTNASIY